MTREKSLFSDPSTGTCPTYEKIRAAECETFKQAREHCEDLWTTFAPYADKHFLGEFRLHLHQRWFEMYLTVSLIRAGLEVKPHGRGPDVLLKTPGGQRVWIEAVCATMGKEGLPDSVPRIRPEDHGRVRGEPTDQHLKRIRNSFASKTKQYDKYINSGLVGEEDLVAVAINVGGIPFLSRDMEELMMRALYGIGELVAEYDTRRHKITGFGRQPILTVRKSSGATIGLTPFVDGSEKRVSLVLASSKNAISFSSSNLGDDYVLYPNLACTNRWPEGLIPLGREWTFEKHQSSCERNLGELPRWITRRH